MTDIKKNAPKGATHYKEYKNHKELVAYYRIDFIEVGRGFPNVKEQFLWYQDKWVYCTPVSGNIKPL
ncbi:MAG: hypothetical protein KBT03_00120 [Bacteroidales bacterium]|nr:hypothetical protein [Candidatus Scybalousia scybalohippi]